MAGFNSTSASNQAVDPRNCRFESDIDDQRQMAERIRSIRNQLGRAIDLLSGPEMEKPASDRPPATITSISKTIANSWQELCNEVQSLEHEVNRLY